jgi:prepilin-type N-terminal cleavage/methylation domain-containing protein
MTTCRRAFTLIELLIVVALIVVLSGVTVVSGFRWSNAEQISATQDGISSAILEARAAALASGISARVMFVSNDDGLSYIGLLLQKSKDEDVRATGLDSAFESSFSESDSQIVVLYELPENLVIVPIADSANDNPHETDQYLLDHTGTHSVELPIVVVVPDGRAMLSTQPWELDFDGILYRPSLESWTGKIKFQRVHEDDRFDTSNEVLETSS